jgi:hypothetical protein
LLAGILLVSVQPANDAMHNKPNKKFNEMDKYIPPFPWFIIIASINNKYFWKGLIMIDYKNPTCMAGISPHASMSRGAAWVL